MRYLPKDRSNASTQFVRTFSNENKQNFHDKTIRAKHSTDIASLQQLVKEQVSINKNIHFNKIKSTLYSYREKL